MRRWRKVVIGAYGKLAKLAALVPEECREVKDSGRFVARFPELGFSLIWGETFFCVMGATARCTYFGQDGKDEINALQPGVIETAIMDLEAGMLPCTKVNRPTSIKEALAQAGLGDVRYSSPRVVRASMAGASRRRSEDYTR